MTEQPVDRMKSIRSLMWVGCLAFVLVAIGGATYGVYELVTSFERSQRERAAREEEPRVEDAAEDVSASTEESRQEPEPSADPLVGPVAEAAPSPDEPSKPAGDVAAGGTENPDAQAVLRQALIQQVVRSHDGEIRRCYERASDELGPETIRVTANVSIEADGRVSSVEILGDGAVSSLHGCIIRHIENWHFSSMGAHIDTTLPFVFSRGSL